MNICIPTLTRFDKLVDFILSLDRSTVVPDVYIVDNGNVVHFLPRYSGGLYLYKPGLNLGVAKSWNIFGHYVDDIKIICNDDLIFASDTVEKFLNNYTSSTITSPLCMADNLFSCFTLPSELFSLVGDFDENISPNYAYFEDNDYARRMELLAIKFNFIDATVEHAGSSTLKSFSAEAERQHHDRFRAAKENYKRKWGGEIGSEKFSTPFNLNIDYDNTRKDQRRGVEFIRVN